MNELNGKKRECSLLIQSVTIKPLSMYEKFARSAALSKSHFFSRVRSLPGRAGKFIVRAFKRKSTYVELICTLLVILFIYTGLNKLLDYSNFKAQLEQSPFIKDFSGIIALTLPAGEILLSLALLINRIRLLGLYLSFFLMFLFTGYIYAMLEYSYYLPCSCGGVLAAMSWEQHLVFNAFFTALALAGTILQSKIIQEKKTGIKKTSSP
jgi:uncharacterized membrane protein YphA (DoxX/SURF4 family)